MTINTRLRSLTPIDLHLSIQSPLGSFEMQTFHTPKIFKFCQIISNITNYLDTSFTSIVKPGPIVELKVTFLI